MTRLLSAFALALAGGMSFGLYQLAYEVQRLEDELAELSRAVAQERENISVLHAEWSYLSRPEALQDKALRHLEMVPLTARQIVGLAELPVRQERLRLDPAEPPARDEDQPPRPRAKPGAAAIAGIGAAILASERRAW
jgi:hypothetical protein